MRRTTIAIAMLIAAAVAAPAADASSRQLTIMQDDAAVLGNPGPTLDEFRALGADAVKFTLIWADVAPGGRRKPAGFDGSNPGAYNWHGLPAAVQAVLDRGMRPFISLGGRAPLWASKRRGRPGTFRPDKREFRRFVRAAGRQFPGVRIWSIWNEPNLFSWLSPQRRRGVPLSPSIYRNLYIAGYRGLRDTGHGSDTILMGELMPRGGSSPRKVRPLEFLREMVCLDRRYRQYRGRAARRRGCRRVRRIPTSGLAYHPYARTGGPDSRERRGDAAIGQLGRVRGVLDRLARRGKLPRRLPIWITEFGYQTSPPDPYFGASLRRTPGFMDKSEWIAFRNRRVASYSQYQLFDAPPRPGGRVLRWSSWQSGLRFHDGRAKRGVYKAFRMPFLARSLGANAVEVFGGLRTASGGTATIWAKKPRRKGWRRLGVLGLNEAGYFRTIFRLKRAYRHRFKVTIGSESRVKRPVPP